MQELSDDELEVVVGGKEILIPLAIGVVWDVLWSWLNRKPKPEEVKKDKRR